MKASIRFSSLLLFIVNLFAFAMLCLPAHAEYVPFVYEGRTWEVATVSNASEVSNPLLYKISYTRYFFQGDTVIGGHRCLNMYVEEEGNKQFVAPYYEENKKVYFIPSPEYPDGLLLYDFSLGRNGKLTTWSALGGIYRDSVSLDDYSAYTYSIYDVQETVVHDNKVRVQWFYDDKNHGIIALLEGIGTEHGPLGIITWEMFGEPSSFLTKCCIDGSVVYTRDMEPNTRECLRDNTPYSFPTGECLENTDIWVSINWKKAPFCDSMDMNAPFNQQVDSIADGRIYISHHYHSSTDFKNSYYYNTKVFSQIGMLPKGDYTVVLSLVDDDGEITAVPYEIPFTVQPNKDNIVKGMVPTNTGKEEEKEVESLHPELTITHEGDSLHVTGWLAYTCKGTKHYCTYEINGESIALEGVEAIPEDVPTCVSCYSVDFWIGPFRENRCSATVCEFYRGKNTLTFDFTSVAPIDADSPAVPESVYDLQGRQVAAPSKGIYIRNNKKVLIE